MLLVLLIIDRLAFELLQKRLLGNTFVGNLRLLGNIETIKLTAYALQERRATAAGSAKYNQEFSSIDMAIEVSEDALHWRFAESFAKAERLHEQ